MEALLVFLLFCAVIVITISLIHDDIASDRRIDDLKATVMDMEDEIQDLQHELDSTKAGCSHLVNRSN